MPDAQPDSAAVGHPSGRAADRRRPGARAHAAPVHRRDRADHRRHPGRARAALGRRLAAHRAAGAVLRIRFAASAPRWPGGSGSTWSLGAGARAARRRPAHPGAGRAGAAVRRHRARRRGDRGDERAAAAPGEAGLRRAGRAGHRPVHRGARGGRRDRRPDRGTARIVDGPGLARLAVRVGRGRRGRDRPSGCRSCAAVRRGRRLRSTIDPPARRAAAQRRGLGPDRVHGTAVAELLRLPGLAALAAARRRLLRTPRRRRVPVAADRARHPDVAAGSGAGRATARTSGCTRSATRRSSGSASSACCSPPAPPPISG